MISHHITLDEDAQRLFNELGGLSERLPIDALGSGDSDLDKAEAALDQARLRIIELTHLIAAFFTATRFLQGMKTNQDEMMKFNAALNKLARLPHVDNKFLIRFRGLPTGTNVPANNDYVVRFDNLEVDSAEAAALYKRMGVQMSHIPARMAKAFSVLADHGVSTLNIAVPPGYQKTDRPFFRHLHTCLQIISRYNAARKQSVDIEFKVNGQTKSVPIICDETGKPDFNLTLIAGLNNMNRQSMESLVRQLGNWMKKNPGNPFFGVADALFGLRQLKGKLIKPPIEVNNVKWLVMEGQRQTESAKANSANVARVAVQQLGTNPQRAAQSLQAVYGDDYDQINAPKLVQRLHHASDLLTAAEKNGFGPRIEKEVLTNIKNRFEQVKDDVFDNLDINKQGIKLRSLTGKETAVKNVNGKLKQLLAGHKGRIRTQRKMKNLIHHNMQFDERDYQSVAQDFKISPEAAKDLVGLLKQCFDSRGHFLRSVFERFIPAFASHEKKVFGFLWHYLKETPHRNDRVAFLNSLQLLIAKIKEPAYAIEILLKDALKNPDMVDFSERNAFMLSTLLLRSYNKEIDIDIELTPEEVLAVQKGLNKDVASAIDRFIEKRQARFFRKVRTIHSQVILSMSAESDEKKLPTRFLLSLERELYIFLALVGGSTARTVLRSALKAYGSPDTDIYQMPESVRHTEALLQQLTVIIRGMGRVGQNHDLPPIQKIKNDKNHFENLLKGTKTAAKIRRLIHWIDASEQKLLTANTVGNSRISYLMAAGTANASAV